jgi:sarcosine oxidase subunit gamma
MLEAQTLPMTGTAAVTLPPPCRIFSIAAYRGQRLAGLPAAPRWVVEGGVTYLWSGVNSWLALGDDAGLEPALRAAYGGQAAIVDQSDGKVIFAVAAPARTLQKLLPIDLHESAFAPDATALTLAGHIPVQIWRAGEGWRLACFRSFAQPLYHSLIEIC